MILMGKNRNILFHIFSLGRFNAGKQRTAGQRCRALNTIPAFHRNVSLIMSSETHDLELKSSVRVFSGVVY